MSQLVIRCEGKENVVSLAGEITSIGRSAKNQIALKDASLSREHCAVKREADGSYYASDLGSRNGTFVNGEKLGESAARKLQVGDKIEIGSTVIIFEWPLPGRNYEAKSSEKAELPPQQQASTAQTTVGLDAKSAGIRASDFLSWKPKGLDGRYALAACGMVAYVGLVLFLLLYKPRRTETDNAATGGLLGRDGGFESGTEPGKCPSTWLCSDKTDAKVVAGNRKAGERSLMVERLSGKLAPSYCTYTNRIEVKRSTGVPPVGEDKKVACYRFMGWVLGSTPDLPAGVRYSWFVRADDTIPLDETFVECEQFESGWMRLPSVSVMPPPLATSFAVSLMLAGSEGKAFFDELRLEETTAEDTLHVQTAKRGFSVLAAPTGAFSVFREPDLLLTGISFFAEKAGGVSAQASLGRGSWVLSPTSDWSPRENAEDLLAFAGEIPDPAGLYRLKVQTAMDSSAGGLEARYFVEGERASELDAAGIVFRFPAVLCAKWLTVVRGDTEEPVRGKSDLPGTDSIRLGTGDQSLAVGFSIPVSVRFVRGGGTWECWCRVPATASTFMSLFKGEEGLAISISSGKDVSEHKTVAAGTAGTSGLAQAANLEAGGRLGEALSAYRKLAADKTAKLSEEEKLTITQRVAALEEKAAAEAGRLQSAVKSGQLFADVRALAAACEGLREFTKRFDGTEYSDRAGTLLASAEAAMLDAARSAQRSEAERLLRLAQGFVKDGKTNIARAYCDEIVTRFPDSEWAQQAKVLLDQLGQE